MSEGFNSHSEAVDAPAYAKRRLSWLIESDDATPIAVLTADWLWDWLYIDELWVDAAFRGQRFGEQLMAHAETFAAEQDLQGLWLWTQSWQAEGFYQKLGYSEFTRFENFPRGHTRIGFRKFV